MIRNNFKISLRILFRNKSYSLINLLGLTSALAISMLILAYVHFELSFDRDNPLANRIVRITMDYLSGGTLADQDAEMYEPAGAALTNEIPEVIDFTRAREMGDQTVHADSSLYRESGIYLVDSSFFRLLNHPLIKGNPRGLFAAPYEAVLTRSLALKYFNTLDVVGKSILVSPFKTDFKITGVVEDAPANSHLPYRLFLSFSSHDASFGTDGTGWDNNDAYTYLLLTPQANLSQLQNKLDRFNARMHSQGEIPNERIVAQPLTDIHLYSHKSFEPSQNGDASSVFILLGVSILVIVIAVVNYINLSTAKAIDRAKEVGIRKVVGSSLGQIRAQFFTEALIVNLCAAFLATTAMLFFLPSFVQLAGLPHEFVLFGNPLLIGLFVSIIIVSTVSSGVFPAFLISSFEPIQVLKGKFSRSIKGAFLRRALVVFQFCITIFLLIETFTANKQVAFMRAMDLGMDANHTIVVRSPNGAEAAAHDLAFKNELLQNTQLQSVSFSSCVPGLPSSEMASTNVGVTLVGGTENQSYNFYIYWVDADFLSTLRMTMLAGANFDVNDKDGNHILVNEESTRLWGIASPEDAVGKKINLWGAQRTIVGVIKDFHQASPKSPIIPMIFFHQESQNQLASVRVRPSVDLRNSLDIIKKTYADVFPNQPFDYFFLDQQFDKQYRSDEQFQAVFFILSAFAILISCLGLYGLVSYAVASRTKEVGIRKVLGANIRQITSLLSADFLNLIFIAVAISGTATYFFVSSWLEHYAFHIGTSPQLFVPPVAMVLIISLATILFKTMRVATNDPVKALKAE